MKSISEFADLVEHLDEIFRPRVIEMILTIKLNWLLPIVLASVGPALAQLDILYEWKYIDYTWDSYVHKLRAIILGQYHEDRIIIRDVQPLLDGRVLITTPKFFDNPASVSVISDEVGPGGPLLSPYPSWDYHKKAGWCDGITNAGRVHLDKCNRLWVVDSGKIRNLEHCPPQIFIFNATTDELLDQFEIPEDLAHRPGNWDVGALEIQTVETEGDDCSTSYAYIPDVQGFGLVILKYIGKNDYEFWRLNNQIYAPDEGGSVFNINGENVTLNFGTASMIILPPGFIEQDSILFKPLSSKSAYGANREELRNSISQNKVAYYKTNYTLPSQELERDISSEGTIISGIDGSVACWNIQRPLEDPNIVFLEQNSTLLSFVSGVRIVDVPQNGVEGENVWIASSNLNNFIHRTYDTSVVNNYLLGGNVANLVKGTLCEPVAHTIVPTLADKFFLPYEED